MRKVMTVLGGLVLAGCVVAAVMAQPGAPTPVPASNATSAPTVLPVAPPPKPPDSLEELFKALEAAKAEQLRQTKVQSALAERVAARIKAEMEKHQQEIKKLEEMEKRLLPFMTPKAPDAPLPVSPRCPAEGPPIAPR